MRTYDKDSHPDHVLRERESSLSQMVQQIDAKLIRLRTARNARVVALNRIRTELARAMLHGRPVRPDFHEWP
jgi:hypothetical protein